MNMSYVIILTQRNKSGIGQLRKMSFMCSGPPTVFGMGPDADSVKHLLYLPARASRHQTHMDPSVTVDLH